MADTVTSQTIQDGEKVAVMKFTNVSDGTGESAVKKVDVSALTTNSAGESCTKVSVARIYWATRGMGVNIEFDATTNVLLILVYQQIAQVMSIMTTDLAVYLITLVLV